MGCHHQTTLIKLSNSLSAKEGLSPHLIWNINIMILLVECSVLYAPLILHRAELSETESGEIMLYFKIMK